MEGCTFLVVIEGDGLMPTAIVTFVDGYSAYLVQDTHNVSHHLALSNAHESVSYRLR
jgi:hypothetical protein